MEELIKNIREMGMDWFLSCLQCWEDETDLNNLEDVINDLNTILDSERSYAEEQEGGREQI